MSAPLKRTLYGETETSDGVIPHMSVGDLMCPVMLEIEPKKSGGYTIKVDDDGYPVPMRRAGRLVYALPGGRTFVAAAKPELEEVA